MTEYIHFDAEEFKAQIRKKTTLTSLALYFHPSSLTPEDAWRDYLRYWFRRGYMRRDMYEEIMEIIADD